MSSQPINADGLPPVSSTELSYYTVRDEFVRAYHPATPEEMLLVNQIARAWFRLQRFYAFELTLMDEQKISKMFESDLARFNAFQRTIAAAERMWRNALHELKVARRRKPAAVPLVTARQFMHDNDGAAPPRHNVAPQPPRPQAPPIRTPQFSRSSVDETDLPPTPASRPSLTDDCSDTMNGAKGAPSATFLGGGMPESRNRAGRRPR